MSSTRARERVEKAHNGHETRGVLRKSTEHTVGASTRSIYRFFLSCMIFLLPFFTGLLAVAVAYIQPSFTWSYVATWANTQLFLSIYTYWIALCLYLLYCTRPNSLNVVKYQTFKIPWRFRRDHVSHMRLDRLRRIWPSESAPGSAPEASTLPDDSNRLSGAITVFVDGVAVDGTLAITVTPMTTVSDLHEAICHRGHIPCHEQGPMYLVGLWRPLRGCETMSELGINGLQNFFIRPRTLGAGNDVVVNAEGWEQGALNPDGSLKDAEDIDFGPDPGATTEAPVAGPSNPPKGRGKNGRMKDLIAAEQADSEDDGEPRTRKRQRSGRTRRKTSAPTTKGKGKADESDPEDHDYSGQEESDSDSDAGAQVSHEELAASLPSKTVPAGTSRRSKDTNKPPPRKKRKTTLPATPSTSTPVASTSVETPSEPKSTTKNPIYHFFENITETNHGQKAAPGDRFYRCRHGESKKILKMTVLMKTCLHGLTGHLKTHAPAMHRLYEVLKERKTRPTSEEIEIAEGQKIIVDERELHEFIDTCASRDERRQQTIRQSFARAQERNLGNWDQAHFEKLLVEWMVVCDQPFQEVERPEFRRLLEYVHHRSPALHIPGSKTVQRRVTDMGTTVKDELCAMFAALEGMVSISLDAWTSSNGYAFIAIVAHYVTNEGKLEELLIDFQELVGEHSGDNMADVVWKTLETYGLTGRVISFMMDNATNNDTLVAAIERKCREKNIKFSAKNSRLRCMPHTIHLAVLQLLESIGAVEKTAKKSARSSSYQDSVTAKPEDDQFDEEAASFDDDGDEAGEMPTGIKAAVRKLRKIIRAVRSSPQRRQHWYKLISPASIVASVHMLILDVKTRWSSTHQMMTRAIQYRAGITQFVADNRDLHGVDLSVQDWDAISMVSDWLLHFRSATSQMSTTSRPMLSSTHETFRLLQKTLKEKLEQLPPDAPPELVDGLTKSHRKLSDYYYKYDQSPFYIWAALLDPRMNYKKLRKIYADDEDLSKYLADQKLELRQYFDENYPASSAATGPSTASTSSAATTSGGRNGMIHFAAFDDDSDEEGGSDELERYFDAPRALSETDPVQWWYARKKEFPRLYRLARDIMSIPGSAVAVERVFSGGRDTISLRRSRLQPETIRTLMLVKHHLRLKRMKLEGTLKSLENT